MKILKYSHFFKVCEVRTEEQRKAVRRHCIPLVHRDSFKKHNGDIVYGESKKFFIFNKPTGECHFHINDLKYFLEDLHSSGISSSEYEIIDMPMYEPTSANFEINESDYQARAPQIPTINYFNDDTPHIKMCELEPGAGKTFSSLRSLADRRSRAMLVIRPGYFGNWFGALFGTREKPPITNLTSDQVLTIQGTPQLIGAIKEAKLGEFNYDFIMMSNATLFRMLKVFRELGSTLDVYGCEPWELCNLFGVSDLIKDEGHMDFHANFLLDLVTHVPRSMTLSGTFSSEHIFIKRMQELQHPLNSRAPTVAPVRFRAVKAVHFGIDPKRPLRYKVRGRTEFNQTALEESILKDKKARNLYLALIRHYFDTEYMKIRDSTEQKALILSGRVEMAEVIIQHLLEHYPQLTVARYAEGDEIIEACKSEVIVSTIISAKAAIDIPNLILTFMTVNVGSKESNLQALGRCRELKHIPHIRPQFVYLWTDSISSCEYYHKHKTELFSSRVFSHVVEYSHVVL